MAKDFVYAARSLRKSPAFALTAVLTIALGIGASTAIFSLVHAVLLRPLPYSDPQRLAIVWGDQRARNVTDWPFSGPDFDDLRRQADLFEEIAAMNSARAVIPAENGQSEALRTGMVTPNFFRMMGARVVLGRDFVDADIVPARNAPNTVILSDHHWRSRYGGDPGVIGRTLAVGNEKWQIVGVLQPGFELLFAPATNMVRNPDLWFVARNNFAAGNRDGAFLRVIGRLRRGVSFEQAQAQVDSIASQLRRQFPTKAAAGLYFRVEPMHKNLVAEARPAILALMGAVAFLLLIACANVANLMLLRAASRGRELAVRAALGGSRWDLIRQMLAETVLVAGGGALLGLAIARAGIDLLAKLAPGNLPRIEHVAMDLPVLGFAAAAALVASAIFGLAPAVRAARPDVMVALRSSGRTAGLSAGRLLRSFAVVTEVALAFVLLIGAGLMVRSFVALARTDPGFRTEGVLTVEMPPALANSNLEQAVQIRALRDRLRAIPGVNAVSAASSLPLDGFRPLARWGTEEALTDPSKLRQANAIAVQPGYFELLRTPVLAGRTFTDADNRLEARLVVIDDLLAAKAFPGQSAVGKRLLARVNSPEAEFFEVIGVVAHQRHDTLASEGREGMFFPDALWGFGIANHWMLRTAGDPAAMAPLVRAAAANFDKRVPVSDERTLQDFVDKAGAQTRFALLLLGVFGAIAMLLTAVGLYGVLSDSVRQRTAEIGVRMALGAAPASIFQLVIGQGLRLSAVGIALGAGAAFYLTAALARLLVGVEPHDAATFAAIAVLFFAIAAMACWLPARRAAGLDPTAALREE